MSERLSPYASPAPGPRDYHLALVDDYDGPPTAEQVAWAERQRPVTDLPGDLRSIAEFAEIAARRPDGVTPDGALREVAHLLRMLAGAVTA